MAVKTLASSGGDYTTSAEVQSLWIDTYLAGLSGSFTEDEILEVNNEEFVGTAGWDFNGINPGSFKIIIRPQTGEGAAAVRPAATDAMRYGTGARLRFNNYGYDMLTLDANNIEIYDMQFKRPVTADTVTVRGISGRTGCLIKRCLFEFDDPSAAPHFASPLTVEDCMIIADTNGTQRFAWKDANGASGGNSTFRNNTIIGDLQFQTVAPGTLAAYNNVHVGMTREPYDSTDGLITAGNNATDYSAMGDVNGGSGNVTSITATDNITNVTFAAAAYDFRSLTTGVIDGAGDNAQKTTTDFYGTARANPPYIGAHEASGGGGGGGLARLAGGGVLTSMLVNGGFAS